MSGEKVKVEQPDGLEWARRIVRRYEAGKVVTPVALQAAIQALDIKPGTLLISGKNPPFDRMAALAGD